MHFLKRDRKVKQVLSKGRYQWKRGGHKKRVKEDEYGGCIIYS
jgi:hypothetical protein